MPERTDVRNFSIIVVDDGSSDWTAEMISEHFKEVKLLYGVMEISGGLGHQFRDSARPNVGVRG